MAQAFASRFDELGGDVIAIQYYRPRDNDFGPHIQDVKAMILGTEPDSTYFISETGDTLEFDGLSVSVDCLFIPGTPRQLKQLLAQLNFYNLSGTYLGTDGWGDRDVYKLGDNVTKGVVFASPFLSTGQGSGYLKFSAAYDTRFGRQPQRLANLGYDATRLAALAFSRGGYDRVRFLDRLMETRSHEGAAGVVTFGSRRENIEMPLYRIENEQAVPFTPTAKSAESSQ
jgi:ABC-type branched-subunit amino acid transport system substrate-binding protein